MEAALELEDDVFFADLSRQISLLIMDDDTEDSLAHCPPVNAKAFTQSIRPALHESFLNYSQQACRRESKGTGVFIPRSSHPKQRNHKQGRSAASGNKFHKPNSDHNSKGLPHMPYNNISPTPSYDSFNPRSF